MDSSAILGSLQRDELDYQMMLDALSGYAAPRDKLAHLRRKGLIVRVKKGLYVLDGPYRKRPICRELLANLIYGPSYVSLDYALHVHGLIPERVWEVTSVTTGRSRSFRTPFGVFSYRSMPSQTFAIGAARYEADGERAYLMATPEKALADKLLTGPNRPPASLSRLRRYLTDELRIEPEALARLDHGRLTDLARSTRSRLIGALARVVRHARNEGQRDG